MASETVIEKRLKGIFFQDGSSSNTVGDVSKTRRLSIGTFQGLLSNASFLNSLPAFSSFVPAFPFLGIYSLACNTFLNSK